MYASPQTSEQLVAALRTSSGAKSGYLVRHSHSWSPNEHSSAAGRRRPTAYTTTFYRPGAPARAAISPSAAAGGYTPPPARSRGRRTRRRHCDGRTLRYRTRGYRARSTRWRQARKPHAWPAARQRAETNETASLRRRVRGPSDPCCSHCDQLDAHEREEPSTYETAD